MVSPLKKEERPENEKYLGLNSKSTQIAIPR